MIDTSVAATSRAIDLGRLLTYRSAAAYLSLTSLLCGLALGSLVPWDRARAALVGAVCAAEPDPVPAAEMQAWSGGLVFDRPTTTYSAIGLATDYDSIPLVFHGPHMGP